MDELIGTFSLEGINRHPATMNEAKLLWMNKYLFKEKLKEESCLEELAVHLQKEVCTVYE